MMIKIREAFNSRKNENPEEGSALIFSLVLTVLVLSIVSTVVALSLVSIQKTVALTKYSYNEMAAQSAINAAIAAANNEPAGKGSNVLMSKLGVAKAANGTLATADSDQGIKWRWYTQRISNSSATSKFYIIATGFRGNTPADDPQARTLRATVHSLSSVNGQYFTYNGVTSVNYVANGNGLSQWGIFGTEAMTLRDGAQVKSYVSSEGFNPSVSTGQGSIATTGNANLTGTMLRADRMNILSYSDSDPNRCTGSGCSIPQRENINYSVSNRISNTVQTQCPLEAIAYPTWVASERGGVLTPGCYNTLLFDQNTTLSSIYTELNPAEVYVKGNITLEPSVDVNNAKDPKALRIYSQGGDTADFQRGTTSDPTKFFGIINSATLKCSDGSTNGSVTAVPAPSVLIYGSLVCSTVNIGAGTVIWWDELSGEIQDSGNPINRVWWVASIEEVN